MTSKPRRIGAGGHSPVERGGPAVQRVKDLVVKTHSGVLRLNTVGSPDARPDPPVIARPLAFIEAGLNCVEQPRDGGEPGPCAKPQPKPPRTTNADANPPAPNTPP